PNSHQNVHQTFSPFHEPLGLVFCGYTVYYFTPGYLGQPYYSDCDALPNQLISKLEPPPFFCFDWIPYFGQYTDDLGDTPQYVVSGGGLGPYIYGTCTT